MCVGERIGVRQGVALTALLTIAGIGKETVVLKELERRMKRCARIGKHIHGIDLSCPWSPFQMLQSFSGLENEESSHMASVCMFTEV